MLLKGKVAIITGSASGIGKEIALVFAKEGAKIVIADIDPAKTDETAKEFISRGVDAFAVDMDVTNEDQVNEAIDKVIKKYNYIDILVSNAGVQTISPIVDLPFDKWKKLLAIQLDGAFLTTKACLKTMYSRGKGGSIIYMGSVHSKEASALKAPYVTAKHGLIGLCKVVAKEGIAHNVRANVICPGYVRTPLVDKQIPLQAKELKITEEQVIKNVMLKETLDGEFTTAYDVAQLALFFASFDSNALTGQSMVVSHGWYMQ